MYFMLDYQMLAEDDYIPQLLEMYWICEVRCSLSTWIRFEMLRLPSYLTGACGRDLWPWSFRENNSCTSCHCWSSKVREGYVNSFMIQCLPLMQHLDDYTPICCWILKILHIVLLPRSSRWVHKYWIHLIGSSPNSLHSSRYRSQVSYWDAEWNSNGKCTYSLSMKRPNFTPISLHLGCCDVDIQASVFLLMRSMHWTCSLQRALV